MLNFLPCCLPPAETEAQSQQGFQDPLSAALEERERASSLSPDKPSGVEAAGAAMDSPTPSMNRQAADGSEDTEKTADRDKNDATDSSSTLSPEVLQPDFITLSVRKSTENKLGTFPRWNNYDHTGLHGQ